MTRSQFIASICAIPFIAKLFQAKYVPFGTLVKPKKEWYYTTTPYEPNSHVHDGKIRLNINGKWIDETEPDVLGYPNPDWFK